MVQQTLALARRPLIGHVLQGDLTIKSGGTTDASISKEDSFLSHVLQQTLGSARRPHFSVCVTMTANITVLSGNVSFATCGDGNHRVRFWGTSLLIPAT